MRIKLALRNPQINERYDVVLIDTQGAVGHLQDAAVLASDILISPVSPDILSAREFTSGTQDLLDRLEPSSALGITVPAMRAVIYRPRAHQRLADHRQGHPRKIRLAAWAGQCPQYRRSHAVAYRKAATAQIPVHWLDPLRAGSTMHALLWG